jgi:hypothetical protein
MQYKRTLDASDLLKKDTRASYYAADCQFTVGKIILDYESRTERTSFDITLDDLNEEGVKVYNIIQEKIKNNEWETIILKDSSIETVRSGSWIRDVQHPAHNKAMEQPECVYPKSMNGCLCSWRNLDCKFTIDGKFYKTPIIIMYTDEWVYTRVGTLYKRSDD